MIFKKVVLSFFTVFLLVSLSGLSFAEIREVNGTNNASESGNISVNETNQSYQDYFGGDNVSTIRIADNTASTGGIKNFMKSFSYQSGV